MALTILCTQVSRINGLDALGTLRIVLPLAGLFNAVLAVIHFRRHELLMGSCYLTVVLGLALVLYSLGN